MISGFSTSFKLTLIRSIFCSGDIFADSSLAADSFWLFCNLVFASNNCAWSSSIFFSIVAISALIESAMVGCRRGNDGCLCQLILCESKSVDTMVGVKIGGKGQKLQYMTAQILAQL